MINLKTKNNHLIISYCTNENVEWSSKLEKDFDVILLEKKSFNHSKYNNDNGREFFNYISYFIDNYDKIIKNDYYILCQANPFDHNNNFIELIYENKEQCIESAKKRAADNPAREIERRKEYYENNTERCKEASKNWKKSHETEIRQYKKAKYHNDLNHKIAHLLRARLYHALKGNSKKGSAVDLLGCSIEELRSYLEAQFKEGMTWDNHGIVWEIDHISPLSKADLQDFDQLAKVCHYTNLQPLTVAENRSKSDKMPD